MLFKVLDSFLVLASVVMELLKLQFQVADFFLCFQGGSTQLARGWPGFMAVPTATVRRGMVVLAQRG